MTPKEKAKDLFNKMYQVENILFIKGMDGFEAKQCALICVDEIINIGFLFKQPKINKLNKIKPNNSQLEYWNEVRNEIKKL